MRTKRLRTNCAAILAILTLAFAAVRPVAAHTVGISRGDYRIAGSEVLAELTLARPEVAGALSGLEFDRASPAEIAAARVGIEKVFVQGLEVRGQSGICPGTLEDILPTDEDGVLIRSRYRCSASPKTVTFELKFLSALSHGHRHLASAAAGTGTTHRTVYAGNSEFQIAAGGGTGSVHQTLKDAVWPLFLLGIEHILTGYDHLVFLLGLILIGSRIRPLLLVITAFTIAHSITLGASVLQIWTPGTKLVEPAIALSIAYIGIENWFVKDVTRRWLITFPFGLIHGFGFAGALRQIALPHAEIPFALVSFNAGVETGQLAVLAIVLPVIFWLRRQSWFLNGGVKAVSGVIACAGIFWFLTRI
jgi:hydrogenase/urease accessory protein HupE